MPAYREASRRTVEQVRYECPSRPRTQVGCIRACCSSLATLILATRPARLLLQIFFSAVRKTPFNRPTDRRLAHFNPTSYREKFASLPVSSPWTGPKIFLKQSYNTLVKLRRFARSLFGDKSALLVELLEVTPDRRTVYSEPMGGLAFRDTPPYRLYYLGAQVHRISLHARHDACWCNLTARCCSSRSYAGGSAPVGPGAIGPGKSATFEANLRKAYAGGTDSLSLAL